MVKQYKKTGWIHKEYKNKIKLGIDKMPAKWHNEINKRKTLHQIKKKGSGAVGKEKDDEKKVEVHTVVFVCSTFHCIGNYI